MHVQSRARCPLQLAHTEARGRARGRRLHYLRHLLPPIPKAPEVAKKRPPRPRGRRAHSQFANSRTKTAQRARVATCLTSLETQAPRSGALLAYSAHREHPDRRIESAEIGDGDHRSERSDESLGGWCSRVSVSSDESRKRALQFGPMCVVHDAVEGRVGDRRISQVIVPGFHGQLTGHDCRACRVGLRGSQACRGALGHGAAPSPGGRAPRRSRRGRRRNGQLRRRVERMSPGRAFRPSRAVTALVLSPLAQDDWPSERRRGPANGRATR
jgi:hypothetical protein